MDKSPFQEQEILDIDFQHSRVDEWNKQSSKRSTNCYFSRMHSMPCPKMALEHKLDATFTKTELVPKPTRILKDNYVTGLII